METLPRDQIQISGWNPRKHFDESELEELSKSIAHHGILEPLIVRPVGESYELVAGERRFRASALVDLNELPVSIKDLTDAEVHEIMLVENLQRSNLQPLEEAQSLEVLLQECSQTDLAKKLGKSQPWVANRLRLLQAPEEIKQYLISRQITSKHVLAILPFVNTPLYEDVLENLKEELEGDEVLSVSRLNGSVLDQAIWYSDHTISMKTCYSWSDNFDYDTCKKCDHHWLTTDDQSEYCSNKECFEQKRKIAIDKTNSESEKSDDEEDNQFSGDWAFLYGEKFDRDECSSCESCRQADGLGDRCYDLDCLATKKRAFAEAESIRELSEKTEVFEAVSKLGSNLSNSDVLQYVLSSWIGRYHEDSLVKYAVGIDPFSDTVDKNDILSQMSDMREDELTSVLFRLFMMIDINWYVPYNDHFNLAQASVIFDKFNFQIGENNDN
ncbi:ParB/RepB/Spo0J family partition protein [Methanococcoides sp. SA1]|nr:ParB/RepB/Spo0J family partition protein [Methanococcoides sp. SA1]